MRVPDDVVIRDADRHEAPAAWRSANWALRTSGLFAGI